MSIAAVRSNPVRLIAVDMDGTLLDPNDEVTAATVDAIATARRAGIAVVPATGRPERLVWDKAAKAGLGPLGVGGNGAILLDLVAGRVLVRHGFDGAAAGGVVELLHHEVPGIRLAADVGSLFFYERGTLDDLQLVERPGRLPVDDLRPAVADGCLKLVARRPDLTSLELAGLVSPLLRHGLPYDLEPAPRDTEGGDNAHPAAERVAGINDSHPGDLAEVTASDVAWVDIGPPGLSKATGLAQLCGRLGIDLSEVAAVGDHYNDLPMLRAVGHPFAMGNALPEVKRAAGRVLPTNAEDGVAALIREVIAAH